KDEKLIGLIRVIGDGLTIIYIQDILVLEKFRRMKIGTMLITKTLQKFKDVRQKVLLTDDNTNTRLFYESLGFDSCEKLGLVSFIKFE
ncbi:MAG: GNAT family N-acetyltransferase, partial [Candidatus Marinimicrobia bacterium]|nr:GNAT family N-acetyltransferase [Candidatus Neomarinimicrobiota bacterium]